MSTVVHKYELGQPNSGDVSYAHMPKDAEVISVGIQGDQMVVWAMIPMPVDGWFEDEEMEDRPFVILNTGVPTRHAIDGSNFVDTVVSDNGIVWHIWEMRWRRSMRDD